jgi:ParB family chromosome partitioning protein
MEGVWKGEESMQMRIEDIIIKKRVRKDLGDLGQLADSLRKYGLLNPIIVDRENRLIAGQRRLEAARQLGWKTISVVLLDRESKIEKLEIEIEENLQRKEFTTDELADAYIRLDKAKNPGFFLRIWLFLKRIYRKIFPRKKRTL